MLTSAGYAPTSVENSRSPRYGGLFHAATYVFVVLGLIVLWRASRRSQIRWSSKLLMGSILMGFGIFNLVEGIIDHHLLGIHHVNETVPREQWIYWDLGFLACVLRCWLAAGSCSRRGAARRGTEPHHTLPGLSISRLAPNSTFCRVKRDLGVQR